MSDLPLRVVRGRLLQPHPTEPRFTLVPDALVRIDAAGTFSSVEPAPPDCDIPETWPGAVLLPGFVDAHLHFPQTEILGSASGPLLPWLQTSVFPEESRFGDRSYAERVAATFCGAMLRQGTTLAGIYSSSHPIATEVLFEELDRRGLRALTGVTWMNRGAPPALLRGTGEALAATESLVERWDGRDGRLRVCVTPRFALSCDAEMLRAAGEVAGRHGLWVQTHLSENPDELKFTAEAYPGASDYLAIYEDFGLVNERSILAHCIHLSDGEWARLAARGAVVAHCPDSNFFLGSGCMPLARALGEGVRVALGTDVGAGRTFSLRRVAASAYDASLVVGAPVAPEVLLWLATRGGALALGAGDQVGCLAPGYEADLVAIEAPDGLAMTPLIDALLFRHDAGPALATVIRGRVRWGHG
ncbi:MAG: guanine deaminase [Pseudomonadota bacterium]|nr:guanine deaminase [Pseudomonadota bacterium]